jgi:hypothetical protein
MAKSVIVTEENETGRNLEFHDNRTGQNMTRAGFVKQIEQGQFPDYYVKRMYGIKTPVSKPDKSISDNLG